MQRVSQQEEVDSLQFTLRRMHQRVSPAAPKPLPPALLLACVLSTGAPACLGEPSASKRMLSGVASCLTREEPTGGLRGRTRRRARRPSYTPCKRSTRI